MGKPIRVLWSPLSQRFYATRAYTEKPGGVFIVTGQKFDVTDDIASAIKRERITFTPKTGAKP